MAEISKTFPIEHTAGGRGNKSALKIIYAHRNSGDFGGMEVFPFCGNNEVYEARRSQKQEAGYCRGVHEIIF